MEMPIRNTPGRPGRGEPPAPQKQRTVRIPKEIDQALQRTAEDLGLSVQAAIREAVVEWLERHADEGRG